MTKSELDGVKVIRGKKANGTPTVYYYHRGTMTRLPDDPASQAFIDALARLNRPEPLTKEPTMQTLIDAYCRSTDWTGLAESTKAVERFNIKAIEVDFGDMPVSSIEARGARSRFLEWRDEIAMEHPRAADAKAKRLAKVFSFSVDRETLSVHPLLRLKSVYECDRSDIVWDDDEITAFRSVCGPNLDLALTLALHTGQRRGDLIDLAWSNYDGEAISLTQSKTGTKVWVPCTVDLKLALNGIDRPDDASDAEKILENTRGDPWTTSAFSSAWDRAYVESGLKGDLHFHDLRGTAVTRLAEAGCSVPEIATITGHSLDSVTKILERYLARSQTLALSAVAKLDASIAALRKVKSQAANDSTPAAVRKGPRKGL